MQHELRYLPGAETETNLGKGKFFLSEYLTILVNALGEDRWAWRTLTDTNSTGYECSAHPFNVCHSVLAKNKFTLHQ